MNCKYCASPLAPDSKFCMECGNPVEPAEETKPTYCLMCGEPVDARRGYCLKCGAAVGTVYETVHEEETVYMPEFTAIPPVEKTVACPGCGAAVRPGDAFCIMCGMNFTKTAASEAAPAPKKGNRALTIVLVCLLVLIVGVAAFIGYELITGADDEENAKTTSDRKRDDEETENGFSSEAEEEKKPENADVKTLYVTVVHEDGTADYYEIETQEDDLITATQQDDLVHFAQVDGETVPLAVQDEEVNPEAGEAWIVYQNGDEVEDISRCMIEDGDEIKFVYETAPEEEKYSLEYLVQLDAEAVKLTVEALSVDEEPIRTSTGSMDEYRYEDGTLGIQYCEEGSVHKIWISGDLPYTIEGVCFGMDTEDAEEAVRANGYTDKTIEGSSQVWYNEDDSDRRVLFSNTGTVTYVELMIFGMYDENGCTICGTAEEKTTDGEYLLPESNTRYLTVDDIDHLDREYLCFARNEIYARHGWIFSVPQIADYFATKSWYVGTTLPANFNYGVLNAYEQANVKLIVEYEARFGGSYY